MGLSEKELSLLKRIKSVKGSALRQVAGMWVIINHDGVKSERMYIDPRQLEFLVRDDFLIKDIQKVQDKKIVSYLLTRKGREYEIKTK